MGLIQTEKGQEKLSGALKGEKGGLVEGEVRVKEQSCG